MAIKSSKNADGTGDAKLGFFSSFPRGWSFADLHNSAVAWIILGLSALITLAAWYISSSSVRHAAELRFNYQTEDIRNAIKKRMFEQEVALWGGVGLFRALDHVTRAEWQEYVKSLQLGKYLPGLQGFGYSEFVEPKDKEKFVQRVRREGFPDFDIKPAGKRGLYSSIVFLEPFEDRNLRAFGYDMWSEPTRRKAMALARDTGEPAVSGMVTLVQETDSDIQRGFLMYLPVYRQGMPTSTVEERRDAIKGFVYSPFRIKDLMQGILGKGYTQLDFRIYDGRTRELDQLMYDSAGDYTGTSDLADAMYSGTTTMLFGGHPWTLVFRTGEGFIPPSDASEPLIVASVGIVIDILLFLTILSLSSQRLRAQRMATGMTDELRKAKEQAERSAEAEIVLRVTAQESNRKLTAANQGLLKFNSIIAHDLRAPLKRIESFIEIFKEEYAGKFDEEGRDLLARMLRGSSRMRAMLDSMHSYTKCGEGKIDQKPVCLEGVVKDAAEVLNNQLAGATVEIDLDGACWVSADANLLEHVIQNLISNSVKFRGKSEPVISFRSKMTEDGFVELAVTDNGIGIEPQHADTVFEMFTRLHNEDEYEGTGVGLAICKKIIVDHGGDISIDRRCTEGTRVVMTLRKADLERAGPAQEAA